MDYSFSNNMQERHKKLLRRVNFRPTVEPVASNRIPYLPIEIRYNIAKKLPRPKWIYNLARVDKSTWEYLQPALYECEVTYEARLKELASSMAKIQKKYRSSTTKSSKDGNDSEDNDNSYDKDNSDDDDPDWSGDSDSDGHDEFEDNGNSSDEGSEGEEDQPPVSNIQCRHATLEKFCGFCGDRLALRDVNFQTVRGLSRKPRQTALHFACSKGSAGLTVALKAIHAASTHMPSYIDGKGLKFRTFYNFPGELDPPLLRASRHGNVELVKALINAGCEVNIRISKLIPVPYSRHGAVSNDSLISRIHTRCDSNCHIVLGPYSCVNAAHIAIKYGKHDILELLLNAGLDPKAFSITSSPLMHSAVGHGNFSAAELLLKRDSNSISDEDDYKRTPLHMLHWLERPHSRSSGDRTMKAISMTSIAKVEDMARYLVAKGAHVDARDIFRITPLQLASHGRDEIGFHAAVCFIPRRESRNLLNTRSIFHLQ